MAESPEDWVIQSGKHKGRRVSQLTYGQINGLLAARNSSAPDGEECRVLRVCIESRKKSIREESQTIPFDAGLGEFWGEDNTQSMIIAALRYCLPRMTYMSGVCQEFILQHRDRLTKHTRLIVLRDTVLAIMDGHAGSEAIDTPGWKKMAETLFAELSQEDQAWVRRSVAYKELDWPLSQQ